MDTLKAIRKLDVGSHETLSLSAEFDFLDRLYGDKGAYPEYDPIVFVYLSRDISPVQTHVRVDTKLSRKSHDNSKISEGLVISSLEARCGMGNSPENLACASLCFSVFARSRVFEKEHMYDRFYSEDNFFVPIGSAQIRLKDILKYEAGSGGIKVSVKDPCNGGEEKGVVYIKKVLVHTTERVVHRIMMKRSPNGCSGFYTKESSNVIRRMEDSFFDTFRRKLAPSDRSIDIYQVPFFSASCAVIPSAFFLWYKPSDTLYGANEGQVRHLLACMSASLYFNNITEDYFCQAVDRQIKQTDAFVSDSFLVAVKAACNALCCFAVRVKYTEDHADPNSFSPPPTKTTDTVSTIIRDSETKMAEACCRRRYNRYRNAKKSVSEGKVFSSSSAKKCRNGNESVYAPSGGAVQRSGELKFVERFIDCFRTLLGDCEDVSKIIYITSVVLRGIQVNKDTPKVLAAWSTICKLYCPTACVVQASNGKMEKENSMAEDNYICHVASFNVPRVAMANMLNNGGAGGRYSPDTMLPSGASMPEMKWESLLEACVLEGTMPTCPLASRVDKYFSNDYYSYASSAVAKRTAMEGKRVLLERKSSPPNGFPRNARNPFKSMDIEVTEKDDVSQHTATGSGFYKRIVQMWCPLVASEGWAGDGASRPDIFVDMAVCCGVSASGQTLYGASFSDFMSGKGNVTLYPSYTVLPSEMDFIMSALEKELEVEIPTLSVRTTGLEESQTAYGKTDYHAPHVLPNGPYGDMYDALCNIQQRFPPPEQTLNHLHALEKPPQCFYKDYVSYTIDPGQVTGYLIAWLEHVLSTRQHHFYAFSCRLFNITDAVAFIEIRLYNSDH